MGNIARRKFIERRVFTPPVDEAPKPKLVSSLTRALELFCLDRELPCKDEWDIPKFLHRKVTRGPDGKLIVSLSL